MGYATIVFLEHGVGSPTFYKLAELLELWDSRQRRNTGVVHHQLENCVYQEVRQAYDLQFSIIIPRISVGSAHGFLEDNPVLAHEERRFHFRNDDFHGYKHLLPFWFHSIPVQTAVHGVVPAMIGGIGRPPFSCCVPCFPLPLAGPVWGTLNANAQSNDKKMNARPICLPSLTMPDDGLSILLATNHKSL
jgi:hypothetical protein